MRYVLVGGVLLWLASTLYVLVTWDFSADSFLTTAAIVISLGGIVIGILGSIIVIVAGIWSGHREKKQWS